AGDHRLRRWQLCRDGEVDEAALQSDKHASIRPSVCPSPDLPGAKTAIAFCERTDLQADRVFATHTVSGGVRPWECATLLGASGAAIQRGNKIPNPLPLGRPWAGVAFFDDGSP